jgi:hypothetical protein
LEDIDRLCYRVGYRPHETALLDTLSLRSVLHAVHAQREGMYEQALLVNAALAGESPPWIPKAAAPKPQTTRDDDARIRARFAGALGALERAEA